MFSTVISGAIYGIQSYLVQVETDISDGLPVLSMVGFLSAQVRESGERVRVALKNAGIRIPPSRITVNVSPANIPKYNMILDLPAAAGILSCLGRIPARSLENVFVAGELGLDGEVKPVRGILAMVEEAAAQGIRLCILPAANAMEGAVAASRFPGMKIAGIGHLSQFMDYLRSGPEERDRIAPPFTADPGRLMQEQAKELDEYDFANVHGQSGAKRALEIAAAGFHNVFMTGPPGSGKSMLSKCIRGILPPMTLDESMEVSRIYSAAGKLPEERPLIVQRPFQAPHHSVTAPALVGGGRLSSPGILSLAHRGILFLDELPEFGRDTLNLLRQPMEDRQVVISRLSGSCIYPARCLVLATANLCPCGNAPLAKCRCTEREIRRYRAKIPGPIMDRFDICVEAPRTGIDVLMNPAREEPSSAVLERVLRARDMQKERFRDGGIFFNAEIGAGEIERYCELGSRQKKLVRQLSESLSLSARAYHRMLRTARTIADLAGSGPIMEEHLAEAAAYRTGAWEQL